MICLGFPARQHHADFLIRTSCRRSHLIEHFGVHVVIFDERVELVRAKLASKLCLDLGQLCLRQNVVLIRLCKRRNGLHRIDDFSRRICGLHRVLRIDPENVVQSLDFLLRPCHAVLDFCLGIADDVEDQRAERRRRL